MDQVMELEDRKIGGYDICVHFEPTTQYYRAEIAVQGRVIESFDVVLPTDGWGAVGDWIRGQVNSNGWHRNGSGQ